MKSRSITFTAFSVQLFRQTTCLLCLGVFPAFASTSSLQTNLTLQAALDYGAENSTRIKAAWSRWQSAVEGISVANGLPDPAFTYGYYFESVETRVGPQNQQFRLAQTFPAFGKLAARKAVAATQAASLEATLRQEQLNLNLSISEAFAELHYLKRSIDITSDLINLIQDFENVARTRYTSGSPMAPILQAQVELGRLEDRLSSLKDLRTPQAARLNAALSRPDKAPLPWPAELPYTAVRIDPDTLLDHLPTTSPELAALEHHVEQGARQVELAKRQRMPDITLGIQYIQTGEAAAPVTDSGKDPVIGTIGINLPLWLGKNNATITAADHQRTAAQLTLENRKQTLEADIRQTLFQLRDADRKINLYKESLIPKAYQSLEVSRKAYEAGQLEFINLIDAERMLLEFELAHERALADHLIARAKLSRLTGINFLTGENHEPK